MSGITFSIAEIAQALGATALGNTSLRVTGASEPQSATKDQLALASDARYAAALGEGNARSALLWQDADWQALGLEAAIIPQRPRYAMAGLTRLMDPGQGYPAGIHETAVIDPTAQLGDDVSVGPFTVIGPGVKIGDRTVIGPHCSIGWNASIGEDSYLRDHITIGARVTIGARFICQPGARIGGDGFSFSTAERSAVEATRSTLGESDDASAQTWVRIHSLGSVTLGDDIEMGANSAIDCGTIRDTIVGSRTKIDNLVHVGHNCVVGTDCLLCGQVGIAGSVDVGNNVVLGGQVGVSDNIFIGDGVIAGGASKILSNVPAGRAILGYPAIKMETHVDIYKSLRRLPKLMRDFASLQKSVSKTDGND